MAAAITLLPTGQSARPNTMATENSVASAGDDARGQVGMKSRWTESGISPMINTTLFLGSQ